MSADLFSFDHISCLFMLTAVVAAAVEEARWQAMARFMDTSSFLGEDSKNLQWQLFSIVFKIFYCDSSNPTDRYTVFIIYSLAMSSVLLDLYFPSSGRVGSAIQFHCIRNFGACPDLSVYLPGHSPPARGSEGKAG